MLNPTHLRTLQEVLRYASFAGAANHLGYTASAVSQQMSALERAVGAALFDRTPRAVHPTAMARYLADRGDRVLAAIDQLTRDVASYRPGQLTLHVGCFPSATTHVLPDAVRSWQAGRRHTPDVDLHVVVAEPADLIPMLTSLHLIDLAIAYQFVRSPWPAGVRATRLGDDPMVLVLPRSHPHAAKRTLTLSDLRDEKWIAHTPGAGQSLAAERLQATLGFYPRVVAHSDDYSATVALVASGLAIALIPRLATRTLPPTLTSREMPDVHLGRTLYALTTTTPLAETDGAAAEFLSCLRRTLAAAQTDGTAAARS